MPGSIVDRREPKAGRKSTGKMSSFSRSLVSDFARQQLAQGTIEGAPGDVPPQVVKMDAGQPRPPMEHSGGASPSPTVRYVCWLAML